MKLIKNKNLENLAKVFSLAGVELFAVGGFVRGKLQGLSDQECGDIDLCSKATISEIEGLAKENGFDVKILNASLGVCCINYNGEVFEHATFRTEVCDKNGKHNPKSVSFVESVEVDAKRRDFTINAIYYNISKDIIFDPFGGVSDLDKFKLKTIGDPDLRLKEDALRMLRAVRIACSYAFDLSEDLIVAIKNNAHLISNLSSAKRNAELMKIFYVDTVCKTLTKNSKAHMNALIMLSSLGLMQFVFPELYKIQISKNKRLFKNLCVEFGFSSPKARIVVLFTAITLAFSKLHNDIDNFASYLIDTYFRTQSNNKNCIILQKTIKYCQNFTNQLSFRKNLQLLKTESDDIIDLVLEYFLCVGKAKSAGKSNGKMFLKLNKKLKKPSVKRW